MISLHAYAAGIALILSFQDAPRTRALQCLAVFLFHSGFHIVEPWFWLLGLLPLLFTDKGTRRYVWPLLCVCLAITVSVAIWGIASGSRLGERLARDVGLSFRSNYYENFQKSWNTGGITPMPAFLALAWMIFTLAIPVIRWVQRRNTRDLIWSSLFLVSIALPLTYEMVNPERLFPFVVCSVLFAGERAAYFLHNSGMALIVKRRPGESRRGLHAIIWLLAIELMSLRGFVMNVNRSNEEHNYDRCRSAFQTSLDSHGILTVYGDATFFKWAVCQFRGRVLFVRTGRDILNIRTVEPKTPIYLVMTTHDFLPAEVQARTRLRFAIPHDRYARIYEL